MKHDLKSAFLEAGLAEDPSHVFQTMAEHIESYSFDNMGFKEPLNSLIQGDGWDAKDSYIGMNPPRYLAQNEFKPEESYAGFEVYIVYGDEVIVPFVDFVGHLRTTAGYYLQSHPTEKAEVQKLMSTFEAHVAKLQKNHDRWLAAQDQV